ncbi:DUF2188 domain-containing protein [Macrococcoides bohemicum]|nr:DUF2188 domain-containing protein [Macrococcus bohemicus]
MDNDVEVYFEDESWKVKTKGSKRASQTFDTKKKQLPVQKKLLRIKVVQ